jgi:hypothetical protein
MRPEFIFSSAKNADILKDNRTGLGIKPEKEIHSNTFKLDVLSRAMKKSKKTQVTLFVIITIIIVVIIALFVIIRSETDLGAKNIPPEIQPVQDYIVSCIRNTGEEATYALGQSGGYALLDDIPRTEASTPYYIYNHTNIMPSKEQIGLEFGIYFANNLPRCLDKLGGFKLNYSTPKIKSNIMEEKIVFEGEFAIIIKKDEKTYQLKEFGPIELSSRFGTLINAGKEIASNQLNQRGVVCLSCINEIAEKNNVSIDLINLEKESAIAVKISDPASKINNQTLALAFAMKNE